MKIRKYVVVGVATVLLLSACSNKEESQKSVKPNTDVPAIHVMVSDVELKAKTASYQLSSESKAKEVEKGPVSSVASTMNAQKAEANSLVQIYFDKKEQVDRAYIRLWNGNKSTDVTAKNHQFRLPKEPGEYVYEVLTYYKNGDVQYVFKIKVEGNEKETDQ